MLAAMALGVPLVAATPLGLAPVLVPLVAVVVVAAPTALPAGAAAEVLVAGAAEAWPAAPVPGAADGAAKDSASGWFEPQPAPNHVTMHRALHTLLLFCMKIALVVCAFP